MDKSLQDLENELKALQPRRAPERWLNQINRELAAELPASARPRYSSATNLRSWKWLGWRTAALAAALALMATLGLVTIRRSPPVVPAAAIVATPSTADSTDAPAYQPVAAANVLYDVRDEGAVKLDDHTAARQVRARYVDTYIWKNPRNNASIKWTVPRDEIRVVPATYNPN